MKNTIYENLEDCGKSQTIYKKKKKTFLELIRVHIARLQNTGSIHKHQLLSYMPVVKIRIWNFKKTVLFTIAAKQWIKYKYKKYVQYLNAENYKTLMKEIKEYLNKWRDIYCVYRLEDSV